MADEQYTFEIISREDAIEAGLVWYFTGVPCRNGHVDRRRVTTKKCHQCSKDNSKRFFKKHPEIAKKWAQENKERLRDLKRISREKNPEREKDTQRRYRERHPESAANRSKEWREKYPERYKEISRISREKRREAAKEYAKKFRKEHPDICRNYAHIKRARKRNAKGTHNAQDIARIYENQKGRCAYCKVKVGKNYHVDHVIPLAKGGSNGKENLQICCPSCNMKKKAKDPVDFAQECGFLI